MTSCLHVYLEWHTCITYNRHGQSLCESNTIIHLKINGSNYSMQLLKWPSWFACLKKKENKTLCTSSRGLNSHNFLLEAKPLPGDISGWLWLPPILGGKEEDFKAFIDFHRLIFYWDCNSSGGVVYRDCTCNLLKYSWKIICLNWSVLWRTLCYNALNC